MVAHGSYYPVVDSRPNISRDERWKGFEKALLAGCEIIGASLSQNDLDFHTDIMRAMFGAERVESAVRCANDIIDREIELLHRILWAESISQSTLADMKEGARVAFWLHIIGSGAMADISF